MAQAAKGTSAALVPHISRRAVAVAIRFGLHGFEVCIRNGLVPMACIRRVGWEDG